MSLKNLNIAVLLPCFNEENTIAKVVLDFRRVLPTSRIYVYDNNSTDNTAQQAALAGATVIPSRRQGKGNVVRQMFADIDADIYLMADGDDTYDATAAPDIIEKLVEDRLDMVVGTRRNVTVDAGRKGHAFGNRLFNIVYQVIFGKEFTDIFSGYRAFTRRFAKSFPAESPGFEIETEMSAHASILRLPVAEFECEYGTRIEGSESKLSTFGDGFKILRMMGTLMKELRPFLFFSCVAFGLLCLSAVFMTPVLVEYFNTGLVTRVPTWMLAMTLLLGSMMIFTAGVILDSVARGRAERKRIFYLSIESSRGEKSLPGVTMAMDRRGKIADAIGVQHRKTGGS